MNRNNKFSLLYFPFVEPALAECQAEAQLQVVLNKVALAHRRGVQIRDVAVDPMKSHIDLRTVVPQVAVRDGLSVTVPVRSAHAYERE